MDIGFLLTYIVCPIVIGIGIILGKKDNNKQALGNMYVAKGILYVYYAMSNIIGILGDNNSNRYILGLTIGLAIIEGFVGIYDGYEKISEHMKEKYKLD